MMKILRVLDSPSHLDPSVSLGIFWATWFFYGRFSKTSSYFKWFTSSYNFVHFFSRNILLGWCHEIARWFWSRLYSLEFWNRFSSFPFEAVPGGAQQGVLRVLAPPNILEKMSTNVRKRGLCNFHLITWALSVFIVLRTPW